MTSKLSTQTLRASKVTWINFKSGRARLELSLKLKKLRDSSGLKAES
jgi:hypothetical protein